MKYAIILLLEICQHFNNNLFYHFQNEFYGWQHSKRIYSRILDTIKNILRCSPHFASNQLGRLLNLRMTFYFFNRRTIRSRKYILFRRFNIDLKYWILHVWFVFMTFVCLIFPRIINCNNDWQKRIDIQFINIILFSNKIRLMSVCKLIFIHTCILIVNYNLPLHYTLDIFKWSFIYIYIFY